MANAKFENSLVNHIRKQLSSFTNARISILSWLGHPNALTRYVSFFLHTPELALTYYSSKYDLWTSSILTDVVELTEIITYRSAGATVVDTVMSMTDNVKLLWEFPFRDINIGIINISGEKTQDYAFNCTHSEDLERLKGKISFWEIACYSDLEGRLYPEIGDRITLFYEFEREYKFFSKFFSLNEAIRLMSDRLITLIQTQNWAKVRK